IRHANPPAPASGLPDSLLPQHGFRLYCDRYSGLTGQQIGHPTPTGVGEKMSKQTSSSAILESVSDAIVEVTERVSRSVVQVGAGRWRGGRGTVGSTAGHSATSGIVTNPAFSTRRWWGGGGLDKVLVTDARLNPGYSGGPIVDARGRMLGINAAYANNRGISVPVNTVKTVVDKLLHDGKIK